MSPARFGFQAMVVLTMAALVSWPEQRQVRADDFWHADGGTRRPDVGGTPRTRRGEGRYLIGYGSASEFTLGANAASALRRKLYENDVEGRKRPTPPDVLVLGGKINAIVGYARLGSAAIPFARVLLRNVATGLVEARGVADENGRFAFVDVMPSEYLVEILDGNGAVVGASDPISVGMNELLTATVSSGGRTVLTSFGGALRPAAQQTIAAAASQGVNRVAAPDRCASPPCNGLNP